MKDKSTIEQFDDAEKEFTDSESQDIIKANKAAYMEAKELEGLVFSPAGAALVKGVKEDMTKAMSQLLLTREGRYLSDFESNLNLLTKLTNAKHQTEAIGQWLDSLHN
jgi:hypothetical protein